MGTFLTEINYKGTILNVGDTLREGDWLSSANGRFQLKFTCQFGLALYLFEKGNPTGTLMYRWCPGGGCFCDPGQYLEMRPPGYLSLMADGGEIGEDMLRRLPFVKDAEIANLSFKDGYLIVQDDGNVVMYPRPGASASTAYWHTNTAKGASALLNTIIPDALNLEIDGVLDMVSDKTLINDSSRQIGVSDGIKAVTVPPGNHFGVVTVGTIQVSSKWYEVSLPPPGSGVRDTLPHSSERPGPVKTYTNEAKFIKVSYDPITDVWLLT